MKRMWHKWLAVVAAVTMTSTVHAQSGSLNQPSAIGSYQSILSQSGYGSGASTQNPIASQPSFQAPAQQSFQAPVQQSFQTQAAPAIGSVMTSSPGYITSNLSESAGDHAGCASCGTAGPSFGASVAPIASPGALPLASSPVGGGPIYDGVVSGVQSAPIAGTPVYDSGVLDTNCADAAYSSPVYSAPAYSAPVISAPFAGPIAPSFGPALAAPRRARPNFTFGIFGLNFQRDYEDSIQLSSNQQGDKLFTTDADENSFDGFGLSLAARKANGSGYEAVFWAFNPGQATAAIGQAPSTTLTGFNQLLDAPSNGNLFDLFNSSLNHTVIRETDINNVEFNLLRNGGKFCTKRNKNGFYELFGGFRWFNFDELLQVQADGNGSQQAAGPFLQAPPQTLTYSLDTNNTLLGLQFGCRSEICLSKKVRLFSSVKGGLFNNFARTSQDIVDDNSQVVQVGLDPQGGQAFAFQDEKDDLAFLGELDAGFLYHLSHKARLKVGYRVLGVSGVALAANQIPSDFTNVHALERANTNGSLILGGFYYGIETSF